MIMRSCVRRCHFYQTRQGLEPPHGSTNWTLPGFLPFLCRRWSTAMADERNAALAAIAAQAAKAAEAGELTIFDRIVRKEIPAAVVFEDDKVLAFRDIAPQAPVHLVLIPKDRDGLTQLSKAQEKHIELLGHLLYTAQLVAKQEGLLEGYRIVINDGPIACQSVYHLHVHIIGGRQLGWPPG